MLRRFSVRQVILGALGLLTFVTVAGVFGLLLTAASMRHQLERQTSQLAADQEIANRIVFHVQRQLEAANVYAVYGDSTLLTQFRADGLKVYDEVRRYLLRELRPEERLLVNQIRERHEAIEVEAQRVFNQRGAARSGDLPGVLALQADLDTFMGMRQEASARTIRQQREIWRWLYVACGLLGLAFFAALMSTARFLQRRLLEPLEQLSDTATRVGAGDFAARVATDASDEIASVAGNFNRMAEQLRTSEERYHALFERVPIGLYRSTPDGRLLDANPALVTMLGYESRDELIAAGIPASYFDPSDRESWQEKMAACAGAVEVDRRHRRRDGAMLWLRDTAHAIRNDAGTVLYYEGALQDVTHSVQAADVVRRSEARFRSLIENASDGVVILAHDGTIRYQSPAVERMLGYSADSTDQLLPIELVHKEDRPQVFSTFRELATRAGHACNVEFRCRHRNGSWRVLHAIGTNLLADPAINGLVVNMIDITTHRQLEVQLQHAQKMEAVGRLAGGIAHDFNNLLTAIGGYTDLLGHRGMVDEDAAADLQEIRHAVARAAALTRQLLAFSRRQVVQPRPTSVDAVLRELDQMLRRLITEDVPLVTRVEDDCWVHIDPGQLEQVIVNLVVNARDAAPQHGIEIAAQHTTIADDRNPRGIRSGDYILVTVSDDGSGIDADVMPFIFEPFFTTKDVGKGTGLGLATVYGIVQESGGYIFAESESGRGTRMCVFLPRIVAPASPVMTTPRVTTPRRGTERILLVEDERAVRSLAERVLVRHGYIVVTAANGIEALQLMDANASDISLLITDVVMPGMGGVQLATTLLERRPGLRVLFISGYTANSLPQEDAFGRSPHFLEKPFSPGAFATVVRTILDEQLHTSA